MGLVSRLSFSSARAWPAPKGREREAQLLDALVTLRWIASERALRHRRKGSGNALHRRERRDVRVHDLEHELGFGFRLMRRPSAQAFVEDRAERVDVGPGTDPRGVPLLAPAPCSGRSPAATRVECCCSRASWRCRSRGPCTFPRRSRGASRTEFSGFRSRWIRPMSCTASSPRQASRSAPRRASERAVRLPSGARAGSGRAGVP